MSNDLEEFLPSIAYLEKIQKSKYDLGFFMILLKLVSKLMYRAVGARNNV